MHFLWGKMQGNCVGLFYCGVARCGGYWQLAGLRPAARVATRNASKFKRT